MKPLWLMTGVSVATALIIGALPGFDGDREVLFAGTAQVNRDSVDAITSRLPIVLGLGTGQHEAQGISLWVVVVASVIGGFTHYRQGTVDLVVNGKPLKVWILFIGNGCYTPRGLAPAWRPRLEDGQLDDAELTMKNITQIKEAFVGQLLGMYHSRIKYPDNVVPMEQHREA